MSKNPPKTKSLTARLTAAQWDRINAASTVSPYRVTLTEIVTRGIELAARELEEMAKLQIGGAK